jgi:hypothetical protein
MYKLNNSVSYQREFKPTYLRNLLKVQSTSDNPLFSVITLKRPNNTSHLENSYKSFFHSAPVFGIAFTE